MPEKKSEYEVLGDKIKTACAHLQEICGFDSVQILATKHTEEGETKSWDYAVGNNFAVYGKASMWVHTCDAVVCNDVECDTTQDNEDDQL